jgi:hypothetical protein
VAGGTAVVGGGCSLYTLRHASCHLWLPVLSRLLWGLRLAAQSDSTCTHGWLHVVTHTIVALVDTGAALAL